MNRRDAIKTIGSLTGLAALGRVLPACGVEQAAEGQLSLAIAEGYQPNFEVMNQDASWRSTWTQIVSGRFTPSSPYASLLFYDAADGIAEIYTTDGSGHVSLLKRTTGLRKTYTHVVPFHLAGQPSVMFFDRAAGLATFYGVDAQGELLDLSEVPNMGTAWTHVVAGAFTADGFNLGNESLLFYRQSDGYSELWQIDENGELFGRETFALGTGWTHVVTGEFVGTDGYNDSTIYSHLFFYNASTRNGALYTCLAGQFTLLAAQPFAANPTTVTQLVAGNFGGNAAPNLLFYEPSGTAHVWRLDGATWNRFEVLGVSDGVPANASRVVAGNFAFLDPEDHWFQDGPPGSHAWQIAPGAFASLAFYQNTIGTGTFCRHLPPVPAVRPALEGYLTSTTSSAENIIVATGSVLPGEHIDLHLSCAQSVSIAIYKQPSSTALAQLGTVTPSIRPVGRLAYRDGAGWPTSLQFQIPAAWTSGLYIARVTSPTATLDLPFVVRAATAGAQGKLLVVVADVTYEAYNQWGGRSVYGFAILDGALSSNNDAASVFPQTQLRAPYGFRLSFERPNRGWTEETKTTPWQTWEVPLIRWLLQQGVAFEVCTNRDLQFNPPSVRAYRMLVFPGHHEYWTEQMRHNVESYIDGGGNVAFLCGNTCWWRVRVEDDGHTLVCYKQQEFDPLGADPSQSTVNWWLTSEPEVNMTGLRYSTPTAPVHNAPTDLFRVTGNPSHWVFADTGLSGMVQFGAYFDGAETKVCTGTESDAYQSNSPASPASFVKLATLEIGAAAAGHLGVFTRGGGTVFNAGVMNWVLGLPPNAKAPPSGAFPPPMHTITRNVVNRLNVQPFLFGRAAATDASGQLTIVARGTDNVYRYTHQNGAGGGLIAWQSLAATFPVSPVIAKHASGRLEVFAVDSTGNVWHRYQTDDVGTFGAWFSLGKPTPGAVGQPALCRNLDGRMEIFVHAGDGAVWHAWQAAFDGPWTGWSSLGGSIEGVPAVSLMLDGRMIAFARGADGALWQATQADVNGPWASWVSMGGAVKGDPVIGRNLDGRLEVFAVLQNNQLAHITQTATGWTAWSNLGTTAKGTPAVGANLDGHLEVVIADLNGIIGHAWQVGPNGGWGGWESWGLAASSAKPDIAVNQDGRLEVLVVGNDGHLYGRWQGVPNGSWSDWAQQPGTWAQD